MKKYWPVKGDGGVLTGETFVQVFEPTDQQHCSLCQAMNEYINNCPDRQVWIKQCRANLRKHLASGKHWKEVNHYYIKSKAKENK